MSNFLLQQFEEACSQDDEFAEFFRLVASNRRNQQIFCSPLSVRTTLDLISCSFDDKTDVRSEGNDNAKRCCDLTFDNCFEDDGIIAHSKHESPYALLPDHRIRMYWDSLILVLVFYVAFVSVFVYSFFGVLGVSNPFFWIERFLDVIFAIDIAFSFFTAYEEKGTWVKDLRLIGRRYLRTWFIFDVIAAVPWDMITLVINFAETTPILLQLPRFVRPVKLLKLFRLLKIFQLQQNFTWIEIKLRLKYGYIRMARLFITVIFVSHLFACLFYFFGTDSNRAAKESWTTDIPEDLYGKYITALYFSVYTITTIGYGDIIPISTMERTYTTVIMLLGATCFAYVISQVSSICSELNTSSTENHKLMDSIIDLQKSRNLPDKIVFDIRRFFKREHLRQRVVSESELLNGMSRYLRISVLKHIYEPHLAKSRLLREIPDNHKEDIYHRAREVFAQKGETLFKHGDRADCFYVIIRGSVSLKESRKRETTLLEGHSFGEADILFQRFRKEDAFCNTYTDLVKVPRNAVLEMLESFPDLLEKRRREELLILWEETLWIVKQLIRYSRMACTLKQRGQKHMQRKGFSSFSSLRPHTGLKKKCNELNQLSVSSAQSGFQSNETTMCEESLTIQQLKKELKKKRQDNKELRQTLEKLHEQLNSVLTSLQNM